MNRFLVRAQAEPSPEHGCPPDQRPIDELVRLGALVLDKPAGPTSHQVAAWVRDIFGVDKAGHGGTLDPKVTGVLPMGLQAATKALEHVKGQDKAYIGVIAFHEEVDQADVEAGTQRLTGKVTQMPPARSAVKRQKRTRRVYRFNVLEHDGRRAVVQVECQGGTYVRTLATDLGKHLGVKAHLAELRRVAAAGFTERDAVLLHDVKDAWEEHRETGREDWLREVLLPVEDLLGHLPRIVVRDSAIDAICHGAQLALPGVLETDERVQPGTTVLLTSLKGEGVAVATARMNALQTVLEDTGIAADPERVLMRPGTYPKGW